MDNEKINKGCSNIFLIDEEICLADSLGIINTNFTNLSSQIINLQNYYNIFQTFYTLFENNSSKYFNTLTYLNQFSSKWDSAFDTIMKNKDSWNSSPIYLLYPNLIEFNDWYLYNVSVRDNIIHWLELNFPTIEYPENQIIKISLNLVKNENFEFNFKKSYEEQCTTFGSNTKKCEKCNNAISKTCCSSSESCVSKTKSEYVNTITDSYNTKNTIKSNEFDLNFLNTNFNIDYGAILKKGFVIKGVGKIGDIDIQSTTLNSDLKINTSIDRIKKILYLNYDINTSFSKTISNQISVKKQISPSRSPLNAISYNEGNVVGQQSLNVYSNTPVSFGTVSAGRYRLKYVSGAMSHWSSGDKWCAVPSFKINKTPSYIETPQLLYGNSIEAVSAAKNYYGSNNSWFIEFDYIGGEINIQFSDNPYTDNRILNGQAPTFNLISMIPVYENFGPNDGLYEMITLTNPFDGPAEFTYKGIVDNQLYLNDIAVTNFLTAKTFVEKKLSSIVPANGTVKISVYTSQKNDTNADYAEVEGVGQWYSLNDIPSEIGFEGTIEWYAKCTPEITPIEIKNCDACKNCDILPDDKYVTVDCGRLSGNKTLNINYTKGISDRSIYRTLYVSFMNSNNKWIFTT